MSRSRRMRGSTPPPTMAIDPRALDRPRLPAADYDDPYGPPLGVSQSTSSHQPLPQVSPPNVHPNYVSYPPHSPQMQTHPDRRPDRRPLPASYRDPIREPAHYSSPQQLMLQSHLPAPYKILCVTNINHKISDSAVKEALQRDFGRYGEISVRICHDNGERLAYIYFKHYEEAREARYGKARTLLFDKPIEIEPIYEQRQSPFNSPSASYSRKRSITPPDLYYGVPNGPHCPSTILTHSHQSSRPPSYYRPASPSASRYLSRTPPHHYSGPPYRHGVHPSMSPLLPPPSPHGPHSPYMTPAYDLYHHKQYYSPTSPHHLQYSPNHHYPHPTIREPDYYGRSPRHDPSFHDYRHPPSPRGLPSIHPSSSYGYPIHPNEYSNHRYSPTPPNIHPSHRLLNPTPMGERERRVKDQNRIQDDDRPTRTIFISNLDPSLSDTEVRNLFKVFGYIEDMEVRRPTSIISYGNAFVRYSTIEMAQKAKIKMANKFTGQFQCKISYGTTSPNRRLWIGGLGPWVDPIHLEEEFSRFGLITSFEYNLNQSFAYIEYDSVELAKHACQKMRGFTFLDKRIRVEFADRDSTSEKKLPASDNPKMHLDAKASREDVRGADGDTIRAKRPSSPSTETKSKRSLKIDSLAAHRVNNNDKEAANNGTEDHNSSEETDVHKNEKDEPDQETSDPPKVKPIITPENRGSIEDLTATCSISWKSLLVLKNCGFLSNIFLCVGRINLIQKYITRIEDDHPTCELRINQRLRLHQQKLDEVERKMQAENSCMLIIVGDQTALNANSTLNNSKKESESDSPFNGLGRDNEPEITMKRPLKNLLNYLRQKDAAGIVSLKPLDEEHQRSKLLYIFPPCNFSDRLIRQVRPNLATYSFKEEYLLGVVVQGS